MHALVLFDLSKELRKNYKTFYKAFHHFFATNSIIQEHKC